MNGNEIEQKLVGLVDAMSNVVQSIIEEKQKLNELDEEIKKKKYVLYSEIKNKKGSDGKLLYSNETMREGEVYQILYNSGLIEKKRLLEDNLFSLESKYKLISKKIEMYKTILNYKSSELNAIFGKGGNHE